MAAAGSSRLRGRAGHYLAITHLARPAPGPGPPQQTVLDSFVALGSCGPCQSRVFHSSARLKKQPQLNVNQNGGQCPTRRLFVTQGDCPVSVSNMYRPYTPPPLTIYIPPPSPAHHWPVPAPSPLSAPITSPQPYPGHRPHYRGHGPLWPQPHPAMGLQTHFQGRDYLLPTLKALKCTYIDQL